MSTESVKSSDIFQFTKEECILIGVIVDEYDKKVNTATRNVIEVAASSQELSVIRSRCAIITESVINHPPEFILLPHPLRVTLGSACSLHARTLRKVANKQMDMLVKVADTEDAVEATRRITDKIGEQLALEVESEAEE